ncbi:MAG: NAD(P)/FAD-dependent oxidoreductase, partial [Allosphingosinicella sp.]
MTDQADVIVIGAGMAGASLAAELADHVSVIILEAEDRPGYHSTGRSAAFLSETYGGPKIQPLTTASRRFLEDPPADFSSDSFLSPRGALHIADFEGEAALDSIASEFGQTVELERWYRWELLQRLPGLTEGWNVGLWEPSCADIDVARLHSAYLSRARA